jgi:hypothetical protein
MRGDATVLFGNKGATATPRPLGDLASLQAWTLLLLLLLLLLRCSHQSTAVNASGRPSQYARH